MTLPITENSIREAIMEAAWMVYLTGPVQGTPGIAKHDIRCVESAKNDGDGIVVKLHNREPEDPECDDSIMLCTTTDGRYLAWYDNQFWNVGRLY